jgi:hypothetical protein
MLPNLLQKAIWILQHQTVGHTKHLTSQLLQPCLPSRMLQSARLRVNLSVSSTTKRSLWQ